MISSTKRILSWAEKGNYAAGSFNTSNVEVMEAILKAAERLGSPVMIETSEGEIGFTKPEVFVAAFSKLAALLSVPATLHMDHAKSEETVKKVISAGYRSVHIDGSDLPYVENVTLTRKVVEFAHPRGVFVEGELEKIAGRSKTHKGSIAKEAGEMRLTDPEQAAEFVSKTGIDCLAVTIGNVHGTYANPPELDFGRLKDIEGAVPCFLSLHGGSGIKEKNLKKAISLGVVKINVNTELREAYTKGLKEELRKHPEEVVPYKIFPEALEAVEKTVEEKIKIFGSVGVDLG